MSQDKRRHTRTPLNLLVQFKFENYDKFVEGFSRDLSEGGVFIKTQKTQPVGTTLFIQVLLNNGARLVEAMTRVVRVEEGVGMGLEFQALDDRSLQLVRDVVQTRQQAPR